MKKTILLTLTLAATMTAMADPSPYISRVFEVRPAPGQFVNEIPKYEEGDTPESIAAKATEYLADDNRMLVSLGSFGGYIVFGFDHMVENKPGLMDFQVLGNAFYANANPNPDAPKEGGSCEPGIVMVSYDANGNGLPDDEWYELAGSEYNSPETTHKYRITYYRPDENKERDQLNQYITDTTYVRWTDNLGREGYVYRNSFHIQSYWPQWLDDEEMTFEGTLLADNYVDESGKGTYYVQYAYAWGYVDNHHNNDDRSKFNIEWAVDEDGNHVDLPGIHFVKVYTGVNQYCGWLGETSTEVAGANDLHILGGDVEDVWWTAVRNPTVDKGAQLPDGYYTLGGMPVTNITKPGIYLRRENGSVKKVLIK